MILLKREDTLLEMNEAQMLYNTLASFLYTI